MPAFVVCRGGGGCGGIHFEGKKYRYTAYTTQKEVLQSVLDKKADSFIQAAYEDESMGLGMAVLK